MIKHYLVGYEHFLGGGGGWYPTLQQPSSWFPDTYSTGIDYTQVQAPVTTAILHK